MALITFDHAPKFVSFDPNADMEAVRSRFPYEARVLQDLADSHLFAHTNRLHRWCGEHAKGKYCRHWVGNSAVFRFEQLEDALVFKLTWA